jgi:hypothetical protein
MRKRIIALISLAVFMGSSYGVYAWVVGSDMDDLVATLPRYALIPLNPPNIRRARFGYAVLYQLRFA